MTWEDGEPVIGRVYSDAFVKRFGAPRKIGEPVESRHQNLAASLQALTEEVYFISSILFTPRRVCAASAWLEEWPSTAWQTERSRPILL